MSVDLKTVTNFLGWIATAYTAGDQGKKAYDAYQQGDNAQAALHAIASAAAFSAVASKAVTEIDKRQTDKLEKSASGWMEKHTEAGIENGTCYCSKDPEGSRKWSEVYDQVNNRANRQETLGVVTEKALEVKDLADKVQLVKNIFG